LVVGIVADVEYTENIRSIRIRKSISLTMSRKGGLAVSGPLVQGKPTKTLQTCGSVYVKDRANMAALLLRRPEEEHRSRTSAHRAIKKQRKALLGVQD
jgi:hypothetical protein